MNKRKNYTAHILFVTKWIVAAKNIGYLSLPVIFNSILMPICLLMLCLIWLKTYTMSAEIIHIDHHGHIVYSPHFTNEATNNSSGLPQVDRVK